MATIRAWFLAHLPTLYRWSTVLFIGLVTGCSIGQLVGEPCPPPFIRTPVLVGRDTVGYTIKCLQRHEHGS